MKIKQNGLIDLSQFLINNRFKWWCSSANGCADVHMLRDQALEHIFGMYHLYLLTLQWIVVSVVTLPFIETLILHWFF